MTDKDFGSASAGDMTGTGKDFSVPTAQTDGASDSNESEWVNDKYSKYLGNYKNIPELKSTIDTKAKYVTGKGVKGEDVEIVKKWRGWGKDTANQLIQNMARTYYVGGDHFSEIIRDDSFFRKILTWFGVVDKGKPINLKPLDPEVMKIVVDGQGHIKRYEQMSKIEGGKDVKFAPEDIFHLAKNRFADEIHGTSIITAIEKIILARGEALDDIKTVFHRYVQPFNVFHLDTDDTAEITAFITKENNRNKNKENMFIPKGAVEVERVGMPQFSTLDPLPYIQALTDYFYQATNTPDVVIGSAKQTVEASAKILILGFEQSVRDDQLFIMENFESQLGLKIELEYPTPIEAELTKDENKDGDATKASQKNDTTAGSGK